MKAVIDSNFARCSYTEAISILQKAVADGHQFEESDIKWGLDMGSEHERYLAEGPSLFYPFNLSPITLHDERQSQALMLVMFNNDGELKR